MPTHLQKPKREPIEGVVVKHLDNYTGREPEPAIANILKRYGLTDHGFPLYRLVESDHIRKQIGGIVAGNDGNPVQSMHRPTRRVVELREVPKYSYLDEQGWVLERWYPAAFFGPPEWWFNQRFPGSDVPLLGAYPYSGGYEMLCGPFQVQPEVSFVEDFISRWEDRRASFPDDIYKLVKMRVDEAYAQERKDKHRARRETKSRIIDSVSVLTSTTLEAGRSRQRLFEQSGHTSHIGN